MKIKKIMLGILSGLTITIVSACSSKYKPEGEVKTDTLYVEKVENYKDDFINGMDVSQVISLEQSGVKYYNYNGEEEDVIKILADNGINYIRVRVWNDPYDSNGNGYGGGNCTIDTAIALGERATKYGMKLLVDFHYSDFWADPSKQMVPKAWKFMNLEEKTSAIYDYTKESLQKLKKNKVDVGMIQIGNEINNGLAGESSFENKATLLKSASKAVREVLPKAKIAIHFANPEKEKSYINNARLLNYYEVDYDIFASSYYPYWHGTLKNLESVLDNVSEKYNKDVLVVETSYANTTEDSDFYGNTISDGGSVYKPHQYTIQGQATQVRDVINSVCNMKRGIGVFYWEGCWISVGTSSYEENLALWEKYGSGWASSYAKGYDPDDAGKYYGGCAVDNQAFFDSKGNALESLKVFALAKNGNKVEEKVDAIEDTNLTFDINSEITIPTTVNAIMNNGEKKEVNVTWTNFDISTLKSNGVGKYTIDGVAGGLNCKCYVSMIEYNFLTNYSFEDGDTAWTIKNISNATEQLYIEDKQTDSLTGTKHVHFWSGSSNTVEFSVEQEVKNLATGKYKFSISIMGGDCGNTDIYLYVKINGEVVTTKALTITSYGNWDTETSDNFDYNSDDSIVVGIYVKCSGEGNGAWGKIDDALLNSVN